MSVTPMETSRVFDVAAADFQQKVLDASKAAPVVVDFWAGWCAPCRMLGPVLEREISQASGAVSLAKLDVDANPELAGSFNIRGIPAVKAFKDGQVVAEFEGARDAAFVRRWLQSLAPSETARQLEAATTAEQLRALVNDPQVGPAARLKLAPLLIASGNAAEALELLYGESYSDREGDRAAALMERARFILAAPTGNVELDGRWQQAAAHAAREEWAPALEGLLSIVRASRKYRDDGARKAMVSIFEELGHEHPLTREWRRQLMLSI
jgi:putative thioredoxin